MSAPLETLAHGPTPRPRSGRAAWLLALTVLAPSAALAEDDDPIPYPGEEKKAEPKRPSGLRQLPTHSEQEAHIPEETEVETSDRDERLSSLDDPNRGFGAELVTGVLFLDSTRGKWADLKLGFGARGVWEYGRTIGGERWRDALFVDLTWIHQGLMDGTEAVSSSLSVEQLALAPGYLFPIGRDTGLGVYLQAGGGVAYQRTVVKVEETEWSVSALKPLLQYGGGLRWRPRISETSALRAALRLELTRFRRSHMDDLLLGLSAGLLY